MRSHHWHMSCFFKIARKQSGLLAVSFHFVTLMSPMLFLYSSLKLLQILNKITIQFKSEKKLIVCDEMSTINPLFSPLVGSLFQAHLSGEGGYLRKGGSFNLETTMAWVLHKEYKVEKLKSRSFRSCSRRSESNPNFKLVNKPSWISPYEVLQSWLIKTVSHLLVNNN